MLLPTLLSFAIGLIVMLVSSQAFLGVTQELAAKWRFSPLFISLVVVALGTNLPELTVTSVSLYQGNIELAMANLIGSSITNITVVFAAGALLGGVKIGTNKSQKNAILLLAITVLFVILLLSSIQNINKALIFFVAVSASLLYQYFIAKRGRLHEDRHILAKVQTLYGKKRRFPKLFYFVTVPTTILGLAVGGFVTVNAVNSLAELFGFATSVLGLTLTAISTSLPELLMILLASNKHENKVVLGTLVGSNVFNLSLFPGIILFFSGGGPISTWELYSLLIITIFFSVMIFMYQGKKIPKKTGVALLLFYIVFVIKTLAF